MDEVRVKRLERLFRYFGWIFLLALAWVLLDFAIDFRPAAVQDSYRFKLPQLEYDRPEILRRDNLAIVIIRRSAQTISTLTDTEEGLQDRGSARSRQPDYAINALRSKHAEYFVAYALGTDLGCPLVAEKMHLRETCGKAAYDFAGRAFAGSRVFSNLSIPDYTFDENFTYLTVKP